MPYSHLKNMAMLALLAAFAFPFGTIQLQAHGFVGERFFPSTIQTEDPFAVDELAVPTLQFFNQPGEDSGPKVREISINSEFTKEIFPKFALGVSETYVNQRPVGGPSVTGFDNLELSAKYEVWQSDPHETIFAVGGEVEIGGTGSKAIADSFTTYTPTFYWGKGLGDLPDSLKYLKPLALTGTVGYAVNGRSNESDAIEWGYSLEYSMPYLNAHVEDLGLPKAFNNFIPLVEFSLDSPVNHHPGPTTGTINPGLLYETKYFQVGAEAVIPINNATGPNVGAVVQVQIYIDDILPKIFGRPIFGDPKGNK